MPDIPGTGQGDEIYGTAQADTINGLGGNDEIYGSGGNDILSGGQGNDFVYGGAGADTVQGGDGSDALFGGAANDFIVDDSGYNNIYGEGGDDEIFGRGYLNGGDGNDYISGRDAIMYGGNGNDTLVSTTDGVTNSLNGGAGADTFVVEEGNASIGDFSMREGDLLQLASADNLSITLEPVLYDGTGDFSGGYYITASSDDYSVDIWAATESEAIEIMNEGIEIVV